MNTPKILRETSSGTFPMEIADIMLEERSLELSGEINSLLVNSIISQIRYLSKQDPNEPITIYINSPGGEVLSGLALYDVMQAVRCPIHTVCIGQAASMAAVLFAAGNKRDILPHGTVMIHDPRTMQVPGQTALQLQQFSGDLMRTRTVLGEILAKHTGKTLEEIYEKTAQDSYFYGHEAVEFGLADRVITEM